MKLSYLILLIIAATCLAGCGGGSSPGESTKAAVAADPFRVLPPAITFAYTGTATINEGGVNRTAGASSVIKIGQPGFIDPRTTTPVLLFTQTLDIDTVESLLYRDFFFSQPQNAFVAHGSEVFGVAKFDFTPVLLLPPQLIVGQVFQEQQEPYETLTATIRNGMVVRFEKIAVAGAVVDAFEVDTSRSIPFGRTTIRQFTERQWYAPTIAGPVPVKMEYTYAHEGKAVTTKLEMIGLPALP